MKKYFTDRSRIQQTQRCARRRWHEYHEGGIGIQPRLTPLPLAVGGSVHEGYAMLLSEGSKVWDTHKQEFGQSGLWMAIEEAAVNVALRDFAKVEGTIDLDAAETYELLGDALEDPSKVTSHLITQKSAFDKYLYREQSAFVEGFVRGYARRRLRPLLEQFEVLEVEREGSFLLSTMDDIGDIQCGELWFNSRPDALLRERSTNLLYLLSFKSTGSWDQRKRKDAEHDMQGLSEGIEVVQRLGEWWRVIHSEPHIDVAKVGGDKMAKYLIGLSAPPVIHGIRYEYLMKGSRRIDKELSNKLQLTARTQGSPLVRAYLAQGMAAGDEQWNWSWDYLKADGSPSKLYYKAWQGVAVWEHMSIKEWIDELDETVLEEGDRNGWMSPAQSTGVTKQHPLDEVFLLPVTVYRNDDDLRDLIEQMESQETRYVQAAEQVHAAKDAGERRSLLNQLFIQTRTSCHYPGDCPFVPICYGGEDIRRDPMANSSNLYKIRVSNHPEEGENG